jgi:endonuclease/exonuclease/phosphatase family metal-dependent hydrolase
VLSLAGVDVVFASVHLESHSDPAGRCAEFERLLDFLDEVYPDAPTLIGGDINTSSLSVSHLRDRELLRTALAEDPERLMNPVPHEPLFALAERRGYDWRDCNRLDTSTHRTKSGRGRLRLDWFFTRQLDACDPEVIAAVDPETGQVLSDHEALAVTVRLRSR